MDLHRWIEGFHCPDPPYEISSEFIGGIARIKPEKLCSLGYAREKIQMAGQLIFSFDRALSSTVNDQGITIIFEMGFSTLELSMDGHQIVSLDAIVEPPTEVKSVFEEGSSSGLNFSTKNQKKNYLRRLRKKISKAKRVVPFKNLAQVETEADEELPSPASSPLLKGSRFYPLASAQGEERIARIARSPPCRRNKKYVRQPATSVLVDGYHWAPRPPSSKTEGIVLIGSERGRHSVGRPPVPSSKAVTIALVVVKPKGNETLKHLDIKGKRPKSSEKKFVPKRTNVPVIAVDSSLAVSPIPDSVIIPVDDPAVDSKDLCVILRLPTQEYEDLTLPDVGAISLQAPASPPEVYIPLPVENATALTTDLGTVEKEGINLDFVIEKELVTESQSDPNPKLIEIIALLDSKELFDMAEYKRYLPLNPKSIGDRTVEEVV
ncbi:hypothetical protein MA16_Dca027797 [Dendrobium catenatum]|uniref:Uncharacterized protein n=1 Tax=Dendrobium catenatum TaxID=906689 RepID=A0A2I0VEG9_9ASPA|nr:hypothetical protein MA16_Dca027797 [Dendrobium catenatum]